jgi:hypothetical protein
MCPKISKKKKPLRSFAFSPKFLKETHDFFSKFKNFWIRFGETIHVHARHECILYRKEGKQQMILFWGELGGGGGGYAWVQSFTNNENQSITYL